MEIGEVGRVLSEKEQEKQEFYTLIQKIEEKDFLEEVLKSEKWEVLRKAWKQQRDFAQAQLNRIDPTQTSNIMRLQMVIDYYDDFLPRMISTYRTLGREALEIAKEQGWMERLASFFRKD